VGRKYDVVGRKSMIYHTLTIKSLMRDKNYTQ